MPLHSLGGEPKILRFRYFGMFQEMPVRLQFWTHEFQNFMQITNFNAWGTSQIILSDKHTQETSRDQFLKTRTDLWFFRTRICACSTASSISWVQISSAFWSPSLIKAHSSWRHRDWSWALSLCLWNISTDSSKISNSNISFTASGKLLPKLAKVAKHLLRSKRLDSFCWKMYNTMGMILAFKYCTWNGHQQQKSSRILSSYHHHHHHHHHQLEFAAIPSKGNL